MDISDQQTKKPTRNDNNDQLDLDSEVSSSEQQKVLMGEQSAILDERVKSLEDSKVDFVQEESLLKTTSVASKHGLGSSNKFKLAKEFPNTSGRSCVNEYSSVMTRKLSKTRVEQAMEQLKMVEHFQENGQYKDALSCCQFALLLLDRPQDIDLRMKFCSNIMQLYYLMGSMDEVLNVYYESCINDLEWVSDPKIVQSIMDLHTLCMKSLE